MPVHQMQGHFELSQQSRCSAGAAFLLLEFEDVHLLALDALLHLNDEPVDLCKMPVSIVHPGEAPPMSAIYAAA